MEGNDGMADVNTKMAFMSNGSGYIMHKDGFGVYGRKVSRWMVQGSLCT